MVRTFPTAVALVAAAHRQITDFTTTNRTVSDGNPISRSTSASATAMLFNGSDSTGLKFGVSVGSGAEALWSRLRLRFSN